MSDDKNWQIKPGDEVDVWFNNGGKLHGVVCYMPCAAGDSWVIENDKAIVHVMTFEQIVKVKP